MIGDSSLTQTYEVPTAVFGVQVKQTLTASGARVPEAGALNQIPSISGVMQGLSLSERGVFVPTCFVVTPLTCTALCVTSCHLGHLLSELRNYSLEIESS